MDKPVLVLVMSHLCGACQNFKRKMLPDLEKELKNNSKFRFIILDFPEMNIPIHMKDMDYHPQLRNGFVEFFPTFILFPGDLWNDKDSKLKGVAKHDLKKNPQIDYSKTSMLNWIDETISKDPLFRNSNSNIKPKTYVVPTYGTYSRFHPTKIDNSIF